MKHPQRDGKESLYEMRQRLQRQIFALRKKRDVYTSYGEPERADGLLSAIATLEEQLTQLHKQDTEREDEQCQSN